MSCFLNCLTCLNCTHVELSDNECEENEIVEKNGNLKGRKITNQTDEDQPNPSTLGTMGYSTVRSFDDGSMDEIKLN